MPSPKGKKRTSSKTVASLQSKPAKTEKPKQGKVGRPTVYTEEIGEKICSRLADGESLNAICKDEDMPPEQTVRRWALNPEHPISANYGRAREIGYLKMAEELLDISDDARNDWMERHGKDDAGWTANGEHIQRARLRVDTRKWILAKMLPKVFGDRVHTEVTGADGKDLIPEGSSNRDLARAILDVFREAKLEKDEA